MSIDPNKVSAIAAELVAHTTKQYARVDADAMIAAMRSAADIMQATLNANMMRQQLASIYK